MGLLKLSLLRMALYTGLYWLGVLLLSVGLVACAAAPVPTPTLLSVSTEASTQVPTLAALRPTQTPRSLQPVSLPATPSPQPSPPVPSAIPTEAPTIPVTQGITVEVAAGRSGLRLRAQPDARSELLAALTEFTPLTIIGRSSDNTWLKVVTPSGDTGWILIYFLNVSIDLDGLNVPVEAVMPQPTQPILRLAPAPQPPRSAYISGITPTARAIFARGQALGNRANVFSKVGDSLTVGTYFLYPIGWGGYNLRDYAYLSPTVQYFSATVARDGNSFANNSLAADNGWTTADALDPRLRHPQLCAEGETPLACEYRLVQPAVALVMFGTNDVSELSPEVFDSNLRQILAISLERGVIPLVSTIPSRQGFEQGVDELNRRIVAAAQAYDVPLWDYGGAMRVLPNGGLSSDGVHPSWPPGDFAAAADLSPANLQYGYTLRNLLALQILDAVWREAM